LTKEATPTEQEPAAPKLEPVEIAFANADVVKLTSLGMSSEVIITKINTAKQVAFKVETDDLVALKDAGVAQDVINAVLMRSSAPVAAQNGEATHTPMNERTSHATGDRSVQLVTQDKTIDLVSIGGDRW
jgi:hypothetical protein